MLPRDTCGVVFCADGMGREARESQGREVGCQASPSFRNRPFGGMFSLPYLPLVRTTDDHQFVFNTGKILTQLEGYFSS